jgi:serine/threonine-protein kinase
MTPERWSRIQEMFDAASALDPSERARYLSTACPEDVALRGQVESLLLHASDTGELRDVVQDALHDTTTELGASMIAHTVGAYRLEREIGEGGMGVVYLGVRADDAFRKEVAVKLLRTGLQAGAAVARFRAERQILAGLEHPNIARLLDGGTTSHGLPYLVMEYVDGLPITAYCDQRRATIVERLRLFRSICDAVQYAHRNLVVHRDLKPSNILVTGDGVPKLLDFGIAKLLPAGDPATAATQTQTAARLMTPEYASPEQVLGGTITTATDVYALGIVLYELLTGCRPYQLDSHLRAELEWRICEEEPQKPSVAARAAAGTERGISPAQLRKQLSGDMDTIVLTALRKDPGRRYSSAEQLSLDVQRYLEGQPIQARPATLGYRARKFVRRHRLSVVAGALFLLLLAGFGAFMAVSAARLARERNKALVAERNARQVSTFLTDLFEVSDPRRSRGGTVTARQMLDRGAERIRRELTDQPQVQTSLMHTIAYAYHGLGLHYEAATLLKESLEIRRRSFGEEHLETAASMDGAAAELRELGDLGAAAPLLRRALEIQSRALGPEDPLVGQTLGNLGLVVKELGDYADAEALTRRALAVRTKALGERNTETLISVSNLAQLLQERARFTEAEQLYRRALAVRRDVLGNDHPQTINSMNVLAFFLTARGRYPEGLALYREALEARLKIFGEDSADVASTRRGLGALFQEQGDLTQAEALYRSSLALVRKLLAPDHPDVAQALTSLATLLEERGDISGAEPLYREALAIRVKRLGENNPAVARVQHHLGHALAAAGRRAEGEALMRHALDVRISRLGPDHPDVAASLAGMADVAGDAGDLVAAERLYRQALQLRRTILPAGHPHTAQTLAGLGSVLTAAGRAPEAEPLLREAADSLSRSVNADSPRLARAQAALARCVAAEHDNVEGGPPLLPEHRRR